MASTAIRCDGIFAPTKWQESIEGILTAPGSEFQWRMPEKIPSPVAGEPHYITFLKNKVRAPYYGVDSGTIFTLKHFREELNVDEFKDLTLAALKMIPYVGGHSYSVDQFHTLKLLTSIVAQVRKKNLPPSLIDELQMAAAKQLPNFGISTRYEASALLADDWKPYRLFEPRAKASEKNILARIYALRALFVTRSGSLVSDDQLLPSAIRYFETVILQSRDLDGLTKMKIAMAFLDHVQKNWPQVDWLGERKLQKRYQWMASNIAMSILLNLDHIENSDSKVLQASANYKSRFHAVKWDTFQKIKDFALNSLDSEEALPVLNTIIRMM